MGRVELGSRAFLGVRGCCYGVVICVLGCYLDVYEIREYHLEYLSLFNVYSLFSA